MAMNIKHQSPEGGRNANTRHKTVTWYGPKAEALEFEAAQVIGSVIEDDGYAYELSNTQHRTMPGGTMLEVDLNYSMNVDDENLPVASGSGPTESTLSMRTIELPLEKKSGYRTRWNHAFAVLEGVTEGSGIWNDATSTALTDEQQKKWRWLRDERDVYSMEKINGKSFHILFPKDKPGVEGFLFPVAEITEIGRARNVRDTWWVAKSIGKIKTPTRGTFGITGGNWLCMGGQVVKEGNRWVATCVYQHSPDGWDAELYASAT